MAIEVVFEDSWLIVVNKPTKLLVIPTPKAEKRTLTNILNGVMAQRGDIVKAHPCHRIDRETSGLIIYAKGKSVQKKMMDEFREGRVKKRYIAFIHGALPKAEDTLKGRIRDRGDEKPRFAITKYKVLMRSGDFTVAEVETLTGRTNQVRIQFKQIGHPLVGERRFAFAKDYRIKFRRTALHASRLEFMHPITGKRLQFNSSIPKDMQEFLKSHRHS